ncbi:glycosyltransferase family 4 protein [Paenibacillus sp. HWE-109]|uniref:glycosyltransferase family 4 protein n=1 Tax=Paenibacillus sp. HWE-109 TaxID=1306526 RepID=UPI001EDCC1EC|nr:glycosyltransferase family 4 protein [Paenibacillus sp. HWE-109]UKS27632.1 glycosyltransferase family 4 protein [Paenibacillus sp. HWE-109]
MKILLATYWQLPFVGGVSAYTEQLKQKLESMGHEVDVMGNGIDRYHIIHNYRAVFKDKFMSMLRAKLSPAVVPLLHLNDYVLHSELDRYCFELSAAYLGLHKYDLIHAQDILAARSLRRVKPNMTPLVTSIHGCAAREVLLDLSTHMPREAVLNSVIWKYYSSLELLGVLASDYTMTSSKWLKNLLVKEFSAPPEKITVFPYGMDISGFRQKMADGTPIERPPGKKVIICTCRLEHIKGIHVLLHALAKVKVQQEDWVCWIVGDGLQMAILRQLTADLGLSQLVHFLGRRSDVPSLLRQSDIFVLASLQENQPFSVMEAEIAGLPVIVSDAAGLPEMVDNGHVGITFPSGNSDALAHQIITLLGNNTYRMNLGASSQKWALKQWSMDAMVGKMLQVYERAQRGYPPKLAASYNMSEVADREPFAVRGDLYNRLFEQQTSNPDVNVDYYTWNRLYNALPSGYTLPDRSLLATLQS